MYEYRIYTQLNKNSKAHKGFHMPGHKARGDFKSKFPVAGIDVTELSYSDNLACPTGVIAKAQEDIAEILGAKKSYILTDGSTCGVMAMMFAASARGSKIIVPRNCHQSVWNACRILGLEPVIVQGRYSEGILLPPERDVIEQLIVNDVNIAGMIVTSPDYYGNIAPLEEYSEILEKHRRLFLVDGAHGAHLAFEPEREGYAGVYADAWVDGAHKSLPTLTQGAILNVNDERILPEIEEGLSIFRTTSPSYPIMASVEYGVKYLANDTQLLERAKSAAESIRRDKRIKVYPSADWTKLVVDCAEYDISSDVAAEQLEKKGIYCELSDGRYLIFYLSPMINAFDIGELKMALRSVLGNKKLQGSYVPRPALPALPRTYSFQYALKKPSEWVSLYEAIGRMCARNAGITPPCIPVVAAGEIITESAVLALQGVNTFGLSDGRIKVVRR